MPNNQSPKIQEWKNNSGQVAFVARDSFSRKARTYFRENNYHDSHMRMGHFGIVVLHKNGKCDVLAAPCFTDANDREIINLPREYQESSMDDRERQHRKVFASLASTHPYYAAIMADIAAERAAFEEVRNA